MKGIPEAIGVVNVSTELGFDFGLKHLLDASATKGMLVRTWVGKVKHLSVRQLWVLEAVDRLEIKVVKIPRDLTCAALMARSSSQKEMSDHMAIMNAGCWQ